MRFGQKLIISILISSSHISDANLVTLPGKIQKLREKGFGKATGFQGHADNPPAICSSSLEQYKEFSLQAAYDGQGYYWALNPSLGDRISFRFTPPVQLDRFLLRSGNYEHVGDRLTNATVELLPVQPVQDLRANLTADGYLLVAQFGLESGLARGQVSGDVGPVKELRVTCHSNLTNWAILSEVSSHPVKPRIFSYSL